MAVFVWLRLICKNVILVRSGVDSPEAASKPEGPEGDAVLLEEEFRPGTWWLLPGVRRSDVGLEEVIGALDDSSCGLVKSSLLLLAIAEEADAVRVVC